MHIKNYCIFSDAIYARPSRRNKRIKVSANGKDNSVIQMHTSPPYAVESNGKESNYAIPRKRTGSIDSADLQLYRTESKVRGVSNPLPHTPPYPAAQTPPIPPSYDHASKNLYCSPTKQAMSLDNLSSYTNNRVANGGPEAIYQSPRYPSLSVDDLLNGIPSRKFHYAFSPLHSSSRSPIAVPKVPKDVYDSPRAASKMVHIGNNTYDAPKHHTQPETKPLLGIDVRSSPQSRPRTPRDTYDDPRTPSKAVTVGNNMYDAPKSYTQPENNVGASPKSVPRTPKDAYDDPQQPSVVVTVGDAMYDTPRHQTATPTKPLLVDEVNMSPQSVPRTPKDAYDDPRQPTVKSGDNGTYYDSPRKPYDYTQIDTSRKPTLVDDEDDPDYSYVE